MIDCVSGTLSRYSMYAPGDHVAVAVSGGPDSVCLLHVLQELAPTLGITLSVAHLNHKLRGEASDADAEFVRGLAVKLGLHLHLQEVRIAESAGTWSSPLETPGLNSSKTFPSTGLRRATPAPIKRKPCSTGSFEDREPPDSRESCRSLAGGSVH